MGYGGRSEAGRKAGEGRVDDAGRARRGEDEPECGVVVVVV